MSILGFGKEVELREKLQEEAELKSKMSCDPENSSSSDDDSVKPAIGPVVNSNLLNAVASESPKPVYSPTASEKTEAAKAKKPPKQDSKSVEKEDSDDDIVVAATLSKRKGVSDGAAEGKKQKKKKASNNVAQTSALEADSQVTPAVTKKSKGGKKVKANEDSGESTQVAAAPSPKSQENKEETSPNVAAKKQNKKRKRKGAESEAEPQVKKAAKDDLAVSVKAAIDDSLDSDSSTSSSSNDSVDALVKPHVVFTPKGDDSSSSSASDDDEIINAPIAKIDVKSSPKFTRHVDNSLQKSKAKGVDVGSTNSPRGSSLEIYCGGLPFSITEAEIREYFESDCGPVTRIHLLQRKGIAFITFETEEAAAKAVEHNESIYRGRKLKINLTSERPPRPADKSSGFQQTNDDNDENKPSKTVVVRNLSYYATEENMKVLFSECGQVVRCHIPKFEDSGKSTGKCFITYTSEEEAARAVAYHNTEIDGRIVSIRYVQPRAPGSSNFGSRGGRGGGRGSFRGGRGAAGGNRGAFRGGNGDVGRTKPFTPSGANAHALGTNSAPGEVNMPKSIVYEDSD